MIKPVSDLDERELLALAISSEEEDGRVYLDFVEFSPHYQQGGRKRLSVCPATY